MKPGDVLDGRFLVDHVAGTGGAGVVYRGTDRRTGAAVAIKAVRSDVDADRRFQREAETLAALRHPVIVTYLGHGRFEDDLYLVMEWLEGEDLETRLRAGQLGVDESVTIAGQVAAALGAAHQRGIVHRDVKPSNVFLANGRADQVKLLDFGIARRTGMATLTASGTVVGTPFYMAPEQARGEADLDARVDVYGVGALLFHCLTGRPPFAGDSLEQVIARIRSATAPRLRRFVPDISHKLDALVASMLAKDASRRPADGAAVHASLDGIDAPVADPSMVEAATALGHIGGLRVAARSSSSAFVGREHDLNDLSQALADASRGAGRLILVGGEPGIGKTRLCAELGAAAKTAGAGVVWGSCWEAEGAPAYWPWIQVLRACVRGRELPSELAGAAADVARLVPELSPLAPPPSPASADPDHARFRLFDAVTSFLRAAADARPHLIVLDDLHWADTASLLLLRFLAGELRHTRLLVVGTYRDVEPGRKEILGELTRVDQHIVLDGLPEIDVARLVSNLTGVEPGQERAAALHRETRGNPFFVREIVGLLGSQVSLASSLRRIPEGVRGVVQRRLAHLSADCRAQLAAAAVVGHEFRLDILEAATGAARERQLEWLQEAIDARLLEEAREAPGRCRFVHALVRDVVYDGLTVADRTRLHRRVGEAIEATFSGESSRLAELAHHFLQAAGEGTADKAARYAAAAGEHALDQLAYEQAVDHFGRALQALEGTAEPSRRCAVLVSLGRAQMAANQMPEARATLERAAALARAVGSAELLARAALGVAVEFDAVVDELEIRLLEQALGALDGGDSPWRARVLARLARALLFTPDLERRSALSEQAVAMARRLGDGPTLAAVLVDRHVAIWGGANAEERLGIASEVVQLAERCGDQALALEGRALRLANLLELGDVRSFDADLDLYDRLTRALRQPRYLWHVPFQRATQAALAGRFQDAESLAREGLEAGTKAQYQSAGTFYGVVLGMIRLCQGRVSELEDLIRQTAVRYPSIPAWRAALAYALAEAGRDVEARIELERLSAHDFADLPRDFSWLSCVAFLSLTCAALQDAPRAAALHALLLPYARYHVRVARIGMVTVGAVAHYLGLCAAAQGRWDDAIRHFDAAVEENARLGGVAFLANSHYQRGQALRARGQPGDPERAREDLDLARRMADALAIRLQLEDRHPTSPAEPPAEAPRARLRREGDYWTVSYRTPPFRLKHIIGLQYIAHLVSEPGRDHHVLELTASGQSEAEAGRGSAGPGLDARAKAAYRERLEDLKQELEEATSWADTERAARARYEMDALAEQLAGAVGLGGRDRLAASAAERARSSVTKAIKAAEERIAEHDPLLADHLRRSLRTGTFCSYVADPSLPICWQL